jgi:hypothetical protein
MDIHSVVMKALTDKKYAKNLRKAAENAMTAGVGSDEHKHLLSLFGMSEENAAQMHTVASALLATTTVRCPPIEPV